MKPPTAPETHTLTDTIMENIAILDGLKRDGWSETIIDRVEIALQSYDASTRLRNETVHYVMTGNGKQHLLDAIAEFDKTSKVA